MQVVVKDGYSSNGAVPVWLKWENVSGCIEGAATVVTICAMQVNNRLPRSRRIVDKRQTCHCE